MLPHNDQLDNHIRNNLIPSLVLLDKHLPDARLEPTSKRYKGSAGGHINSRQDSVTITAAQLSAELQLGEVIRETNQGRKNIIDDIGGVRALTGKKVTYQGKAVYLVTVDLDGPNAQKELDGLMGDRQIPATVTWGSGKPGRSTKLFKIPEGKHGGLKGKAKIGSKQDESEVEFHFTSSGSILPPSPHPETDGYKWLPGCSLDEIAIADLPDCLLEVMKDRQPKAKPINSLDDISLPVDQPIPLLECCTKEVRALIKSGVPEGSGHNDKALEVSMELVAVERYLKRIKQPFLDTPEILYQQFVTNSSIEYGPKEKGRLDGACKKEDNGPGCKPEGVDNCIRGWYWREHLKQGGAKFNNVTPINKHQKRNYQEPQKDLNQTLLELTEQGLDGSLLESELIAIANDRGLILNAVKNLYKVVQSERGQEELREDQKADLTSLINAGRQRLNLAEYLPEPLAKTLTQIAKIIGTTPEAFLTILLPTIAASSHPHNKLELIRATNFYASPIFWIALVIESGGAKTPAMNQIIDPYKRLQYEEDQRFKEETKAYEQELQAWQMGTPEQKRHEAPPEKPRPPREYFVQDFTSEAIAKIQDNQPDCGFLIPLDELSALINNQNAYKGKGTDQEKLLSARDGSGIKVNRADGRRLSSPRSTYSIVGGIQPDLLRQQMGDHQDSQGHFARFSYCTVPILPAPFIRNVQLPDIGEMLYAIYKELSSAPEGKLFKLSQTATDAYENWFNELDRLRYNEPNQAMRAVYAKAKKQTGEIALLLHLLWAAFDKETPADWISLEITQAAIKLSAFYIEQIKGIYIKSDTTSLTPKLSRIMELAERKGTITARIVKQSDRAFKNDSPETIRGYFTELVKMGLGSTRGKIASLSFSVDKVDNCRQIVDNCLQAENLDNKGIMTTTTTTVDTVDTNSSPNATFTPPDTFISKVSTLSTVENQIPESHIQQTVDTCRQDVDGCLQVSTLSTDNSDKNKNIVSPLVFIPGDRVRHPSYGLGIVNEIDGEWYCLWDTLSGGQMRLITEDFQMMEKIA
jgi:CRISPR-associated protein Cmr3